MIIFGSTESALLQSLFTLRASGSLFAGYGEWKRCHSLRRAEAFSLVTASGGPSLVALLGLLIAVAPHATECGLRSCGS